MNKCKNCGKKLPSFSEILKKRFCSIECEKEYNRKNKNPDIPDFMKSTFGL